MLTQLFLFQARAPGKTSASPIGSWYNDLLWIIIIMYSSMMTKFSVRHLPQEVNFRREESPTERARRSVSSADPTFPILDIKVDIFVEHAIQNQTNDKLPPRLEAPV